MDVIEAKDPLLVEVENKAGSHVDYLWVTDDGTPITMEQTKVSSTFPYRGGDVTKGDYTGSGTWHNGTDFTTSAGNDQRIWQVAIWGGTVVEAEMNGTDRSYGYTVVIDHGNGFYTRYAHMGYGIGYYPEGNRPTPKSWENQYAPGATTTGYEKLGVSSLCVKEGDVVQAGDRLGTYGTTGHSSNPHAHVEMFLTTSGAHNQGTRWRAGVSNILLLGKDISEINWYKTKTRDGALWEDITDAEIPVGEEQSS
jgi:murein DD-endopeptidase MepM/ murein hydrolase activator NlpD